MGISTDFPILFTFDNICFESEFCSILITFALNLICIDARNYCWVSTLILRIMLFGIHKVHKIWSDSQDQFNWILICFESMPETLWWHTVFSCWNRKKILFSNIKCQMCSLQILRNIKWKKKKMNTMLSPSFHRSVNCLLWDDMWLW